MSEAFLSEVETWIGTPRSPAGARKGKYSSCVGFIVRSLAPGGHPALAEMAIPWIQYSDLPHPMFLCEWCESHLTKVQKNDVKGGDLLLFRFRNPCHLTVVKKPGIIVDCSETFNRVCAHPIPGKWQLCGAYRL